jgi:hypothetical protein
MKYIFILFSVLIAHFAFSQSTTLVLGRIVCKARGVSVWGSDTVRIYRLPEDTLAYTVVIDTKKKGAVVPGIKPGKYKMVYENNYKSMVSKTVILEAVEYNHVSLCVDPVAIDDEDHQSSLTPNDKPSAIVRGYTVTPLYAAFSSFRTFNRNEQQSEHW